MKSTFNRERLSNPFIINDEAKFVKKLAKIMLNSFATKLIKQGKDEEEKHTELFPSFCSCVLAHSLLRQFRESVIKQVSA